MKALYYLRLYHINIFKRAMSAKISSTCKMDFIQFLNLMLKSTSKKYDTSVIENIYKNRNSKWLENLKGLTYKYYPSVFMASLLLILIVEEISEHYSGPIVLMITWILL